MKVFLFSVVIPPLICMQWIGDGNLPDQKEGLYGEGCITSHDPATGHLSAEDREVPTMTKPKMLYFDQEDILHLVVSEEEEANSIELSPNITAELNEKGELIGIEILNASTFLRDAIMEGVQAKMLHLTPAEK